jgi:predicted dehydrogenase
MVPDADVRATQRTPFSFECAGIQVSSTHPRVGVIGGGIRGSMFARAVAQHPEATLVAMCEPAAAARERNAHSLGVPVYADLGTMLDAHPDLTAAIIATPDFAHRDPAVACAERGLDLLVEKPLATSVADAEAIVAAVAAGGARVMVGFENRWNPKFLEVRRQLSAGAAGRIVNQVADLNDTLFVPTRMLSWAASSSPAWFLMPHSLDLTMWISDASPTEVFARGTSRLLPSLGVDTWDAVTASFAMSDGSIVVLNSQWVLPVSAPAVFDFRYEVNTETSSFRLGISDSGVTRYDPDGVSWLQFGVYERHGRLRGTPIDMADDFIAWTAGAQDSVPDAAHGLLVTRAIEAVHRSLDTGQPQPI